MPRRYLFACFRLVYRVSQWLRKRLTPTGFLMLGGIVASGIFSMNTRQSLAYQVLAITAACMLVAILGSLTFRGRFSLQRRLPDHATAGMPLRYGMLITNHSPRHQRDLVLLDELEAGVPEYRDYRLARDPEDKNRNWVDRMIGYPRLMSLIRQRRGGSIPAREVPPLPAGDRVEVGIEFIPRRRGRIHFSVAHLGHPDPLGLIRALRHYPMPESMLVLPRTYRVPHLKLSGHRKYTRGGETLASEVGDSQEFLSLRDYQPGDPLRSIHWRSYAKVGEPVVKEYQDEFFARRGLVLDTFIGDRSERLFEEAVSVAASLQLAMQGQDSLLDLMFVANRAYSFSAGRGLGTAANMLEVLACVRPCVDGQLDELQALLLQHAGEMSGLILVMLDWDGPRQELVRGLLEFGIPLLVLVVTETDADDELSRGPLAETPERLIALPCDRVQAVLDRLAWPDT